MHLPFITLNVSDYSTQDGLGIVASHAIGGSG